MKKICTALTASNLLFIISACQTTSQTYNGHTGYQIEQNSAQSAVISYTLAIKENTNKTTAKLQSACKKVIGRQQNYKIDILSNSEMINPANNPSSYGIGIGQSKTSFELAQINNDGTDQSSAARTAINTHPQVLNIIRYRCTI